MSEVRLRRVWDLPAFDRRTITLLDKHLAVLLGHNGPAEVFCRGKPFYVRIRPSSQILGPGELGYSQRSQKNKNAFWSDHVQDSFSWVAPTRFFFVQARHMIIPESVG